MNVNELTDLIVKITRSNKKQQYSRALASVINDEKGAPIFNSLNYVFNESVGDLDLAIGKYKLRDPIKYGKAGYYPYWLVLSKEQYDKFGREVQYIKDGQCIYTETLNQEMFGPIPEDLKEQNAEIYDMIKGYYGLFLILYPVLNLITDNKDYGWYGAEQVIITYDGVQYKYDKNDLIIDVDENESVSTQSFNLLNQEV